MPNPSMATYHSQNTAQVHLQNKCPHMTYKPLSGLAQTYLFSFISCLLLHQTRATLNYVNPRTAAILFVNLFLCPFPTREMHQLFFKKQV